RRFTCDYAPPTSAPNPSAFRIPASPRVRAMSSTSARRAETHLVLTCSVGSCGMVSCSSSVLSRTCVWDMKIMMSGSGFLSVGYGRKHEFDRDQQPTSVKGILYVRWCAHPALPCDSRTFQTAEDSGPAEEARTC
ncbi:unnamed protein product, partial [Mycena citricolor]